MARDTLLRQLRCVVPQPARPARFIHFGLFEADLAARELRREGSKVKIQGRPCRPFEILSALLEHPKQVVSREEYRQRIWPADTFVDFDQSLNTSIIEKGSPVYCKCGHLKLEQLNWQ